jgi:hypothetical protein
MRKFLALIAFLVLLLPGTASAVTYNGDFEYGYYTNIIGEPHQVSAIDNHSITPCIGLTHITRERDYNGPFSYGYIDVNRYSFDLSFNVLLINKDDTFSFDKHATISARIGNKNFLFAIKNISHNKKTNAVTAYAELSDRFMTALWNELQNGDFAKITFSVPVKNGKFSSITYSKSEIQELLESMSYFRESL